MFRSHARTAAALLFAVAAISGVIASSGLSRAQSGEPAEHLVVLAPGLSDGAYRHFTDHARFVGGQMRLEYPPAAFTAMLDASARKQLATHAGVVAVSAEPVDVQGLKGPALNAARSWNDHASGEIPAAAGAAPFESPQDEREPTFAPDGPVRIAPDTVPPDGFGPEGGDTAGAPTNSQTSEYMAGRISVSVVFVESNGGAGNCSPADAQTENWSVGRQETVINEITEGVSFWLNRTSRPSPLSFIIDNQGSRATSCEPINRSDADEGLWISDVLTGMGYPANSGNYRSVARSFADSRRDALAADWGYTIFVADSLNDADGKFTNGGFAYAYLNGPFVVMTYDNNGWQIDKMNLVTAHETGHIFGALDEYPQSNCTTADSWGYLNSLNTSCNNGGDTSDLSIMGPSAEQNNGGVDVSQSARAAIGSRNPSDATTSAVVDVVRNSAVTLSAFSPDPTTDTTPTYYGSGTNLPYPPAGPRMRNGQAFGMSSPVTIAKVAGAEWAVDGGAFGSAGVVAADGAFDEETDSFSFTPVGPVGGGLHAFAARAVNQFGHASSELSDSLTIICAVANDCFADSISIGDPLPYANAQVTTGTTRQTSEPLVQTQCGTPPDDMDTTVWYSYTPTFEQTLRADTFGSGFDTRLAVHTGSSLGALTLLGCNDDAAGGEQSEVVFHAVTGTTYRFQVDGFAGATGSLTFNLTQVMPDLEIDSVTVDPAAPAAGQQADITVTVENSGGHIAGSFYIDYYAHAPGPPSAVPGDFRCTVTTLAVGATTLCQGNTTYAAVGQHTLWAQVDIEDLVMETDETNNVFGPQVINVVADADFDGVLDAVDNCPNWPNPAQTLPVLWTVPPGDTDCDGYADGREAYLGTQSANQCAADAVINNEHGADRWPMDMNDDGKATTLDVGAFVFTLNESNPNHPGPNTNPAFNPRHDFNGSGLINTLDVGRFVFVLNDSCTQSGP